MSGEIGFMEERNFLDGRIGTGRTTPIGCGSETANQDVPSRWRIKESFSLLERPLTWSILLGILLHNRHPLMHYASLDR